MKELWSSLASIMGVVAFCQSLLHAVLPHELRIVAVKLYHRLFGSVSSYCYFDVTEIDGVSTNELYTAVQLYLSSSASVSGTRLSVTRPLNSSAFTFSLSNNDRLLDSFLGAALTWEHTVAARQSQAFSWRPLPEEKRGFTLRIKKSEKHLVLEPYLEHIMNKAAEVRRRNQDRLLYTNSSRGGGGGVDSRGFHQGPWESVPFKHPSTFNTLAMDPARKREIMEDLKDFAEDGKAFYERTGRAWKRGYLLYGPPGTGKSSMIAAMANFLGYDIYDLELTEVHTNSELRKLLMKTTSKSIIVIEDIDCSLNLAAATSRAGTTAASGNNINEEKENPCGGREDSSNKSVTLSGLLNFTDGLWSCCGSERIFVFTTNHIEKIDPALLRSGRMDMHIFMSYCSFAALKILMKNYLGLGEEEEEVVVGCGEVMRELEEVIDDAEMTPADISEVLIKNRRGGKGKAMRELLKVLNKNNNKKKKNETGGGGVGEEEESERGNVVEEDEEQEKRALESPREGVEELDNCNGNGNGTMKEEGKN